MELTDKWKTLARSVNGRVVKYYGTPQIEAVKGLIEIEHGKIPAHISKYHLTLPNSLSDKKVYLLDIETCGLSHNAPINLITVGGINGEFITRTYFALDYSGEKSILLRTLNLLKKADIVFTYNGTSFDLARLSKRMIAYGLFNRNGPSNIDEMLLGKHCDLYPIVLELTKKKGIGLFDRKLQTLEKRLFLSHREEEVKGSEIPQAYRDFVYWNEEESESDNNIMKKMIRVINHNILDVASMGAVLEFLKREGHVPVNLEDLIKKSKFSSRLVENEKTPIENHTGQQTSFYK